MFTVANEFGEAQEHKDADLAYILPSQGLQLDDARGKTVAIYAPGRWVNAIRQPTPDRTTPATPPKAQSA